MLGHIKNKSLATITLLAYTLLLFVPHRLGLGISDKGAGAPFIGTLFTVAALFGAALTVLLLLITHLERKVEKAKKRVAETETELQQISLAQEHSADKRSFEVSVINASLHREIAERMQAELQSKALQKQMELILNSAGEGIFGLDTNGNVMFVNTAASLMLGWESQDLLGKSHHDLVHHSHADGSPHHPDSCPIQRAYQDGIVHASSEDVFWTREGTCFPVEYVSTPIVDDQVIQGAVVVFRDLSVFS